MAGPEGTAAICLRFGTNYSGVDTLAVDPLPAAQVGSKILVRRNTFDRWLEAHLSSVLTCAVS